MQEIKSSFAAIPFPRYKSEGFEVPGVSFESFQEYSVTSKETANKKGQPREWLGTVTMMSRTHVPKTIPAKIMVPVDFSQSSHFALKTAADLAERFNAQIHLVHVIPAFPVTTFADFIPEADVMDKARIEAERAFAACQADLDKKGVRVSTSIEVGSDVAGIILDLTEKEHVDLLVISTHGVAGWYPMVFGSVAEKIVKLVQCPVLLLRTPKPESSAKVPTGSPMEWW